MPQTMTQQKQCRKCGQVKPISEFHKHQKTRDGYQHICTGCNSGKFINMVGHRYGRLMIIEKTPGANKKLYRSTGTWWRCQCDCGNTTVTRGVYLRSGHTKSCGCLQREGGRLPKGEAAFNQALLTMRGNAKRRRLIWGLTKEQVHILTRQPCHYCGAGPNNVEHGKHGSYTYSGLDRIDNNQGYTINNVVSCCKDCNVAKATRTVEEFVGWAQRVYHYTFKIREELGLRENERLVMDVITEEETE